MKGSDEHENLVFLEIYENKKISKKIREKAATH